MAFRDIVFPIEFLNIHQYCGFDSVLAGLSYYRIGGQQHYQKIPKHLPEHQVITGE